MKVHVYASYKRSPVGFQLGSFSYIKDQMENYTLSFCQDSKIIYEIFEQDFITEACGRLPHSNNNLFLIKDLEYTYDNHDEFGKIVYINIAFEISDSNEFSKFVSGYKTYDESILAEKMANFIIPDDSNKEYGFVINAEHFNCFVNELLDRSVSQNANIERFELVTKASNRTSFDEKVREIFNLRFKKDENKYYYPPKKKSWMNWRIHQNPLSNHSKKNSITSVLRIVTNVLLSLLTIAGVITILFAFIKWLMFFSNDYNK